MEPLGAGESLGSIVAFSVSIAFALLLVLLLGGVIFYYKRRLSAAISDAQDVAVRSERDAAHAAVARHLHDGPAGDDVEDGDELVAADGELAL